MSRLVTVIAAVVGGVALLGVGLLLGTKMGEEQAQVAAADAQGPLSQKDSLILPTFSEASGKFDSLLIKAKDGKNVSKQLTEQAVIVLKVERAAEAPDFKEAVGDTGDAMLLLSAGLVADDGDTVEVGIAAYQKAQEKLFEIANEINELNGVQPETSDESTETPDETGDETTSE